MTVENIREDEWVAEMERLAEIDGDGATTRELAALWRCNTDTALARLRMLMDSGRLAVSRKMVLRLDGRRSPVASYRLKNKEVP